METPAERLEREAERAARELLVASVAAPDERSLEEVAARVAVAVAEAEPRGHRTAMAARFRELLAAKRFLPSVPVLANAGTRGPGQLGACFVVEPQDALDAIYRSLAEMARIQQGGGGVGIQLSRLRPRGAPIEGARGRSPGPVAFAELFAHAARINALAGRRPGAHLAVLRDDHPDLLDFVAMAAGAGAAHAGLGLAVGVRDALFHEAQADDSHLLTHPRGGAPRRVPARLVLREIARAIARTGEPTLLFLDTIEAANPTPELGTLETTNPCGEQPLLPGESCVLGSLVLPAFADGSGRIDARALASAAALAVRFLDDVAEVTRHPDAETERASRRTRKLGLGVMGFADLLLLRGERYDGPGARSLAREIGSLLLRASRGASETLASERGPFPAWRGPGAPRRNATTLAMAPTGTIRLLARASAGIEPLLAPVVRVVGGDGRVLRWSDATLVGWLAARAADPEEVIEALAAGAPAAGLPGLEPDAAALLARGSEVSPEAQIARQADFQRFSDGAVAKTVHLPEEVDPARVEALLRRAWESRCKGVALYPERGPGVAPCVRCAGPPEALLEDAPPAAGPRRLDGHQGGGR